MMAASGDGEMDPQIRPLHEQLDDARTRTAGLSDRTTADTRLDQFNKELLSLEENVADAGSADAFRDWIDDLANRLDEFRNTLPDVVSIEADRIVREGIERVDREIAAGRFGGLTDEEVAWLEQNLRHKQLSYDKDIKWYRPAEGKSILTAKKKGS